MTTPRTTTQLDQARTDLRGEPYFVGSAYGPDDAEAHTRLMARLQTMTREEFLASLVAAGIYTAEGTLQPPYGSEESTDEDAAPSGGYPAAR